MDFTEEYAFYRELLIRINSLPGRLAPVENEVLLAIKQALRVHHPYRIKKMNLKKTVRRLLILKDMGEINLVW